MRMRWSVFAVGCVAAASLGTRAADWPQWRGPDRRDISSEKGLLTSWPKDGPPLLWKYDNAGIGFSGPAIVGDRLYTMGARDEMGYVFALDVKTGQEVWHTRLGPIISFKITGYGDGPRGTPTVDGKLLYALGEQGELVCLQAADGKEIWRKNLVKDFGGQIMEYEPGSNWGYSESPLIDGDKLVCCPGGPQGTIIALDKKTGSLIWRSAELKDQATDSSIMPAEIDGVRQYIQTTFKGSGMGGGAVVGVAAKDGKMLWEFPINRYDIYAIIPTPVVRGDLVYATAGYNAGCDLLKITRDAKGNFKATEMYNRLGQRVMKNEHGGVVLVGNYIYGYSDGKGWVCQDFKTGKVVWDERNRLEGKGSLTCANGYLYLFSDTGVAALIKATPDGWQESGRFTLPQTSKVRETRRATQSAGVWTHPVVANGRLYLRDQELLYCYDVRGK